MKAVRYAGLAVLFVAATAVSWSVAAVEWVFDPSRQAVQFNICPKSTSKYDYNGAIAPAYRTDETGRNYKNTADIVNAGDQQGLLSSADGTWWNMVGNGNMTVLDTNKGSTGVKYGCAYANTTRKTIEWDYYPGDYVGLDRDYGTPPSDSGVLSTMLMATAVELPTDGYAMGFYATGLAPGEYQIFVLCVVPGYESRVREIGIEVFSDLGRNNPPVDLTQDATWHKTTKAGYSETWEQDKNYVMQNITIHSADDYLFIMCIRSDGGFHPGFNGLQIVPVMSVPEPATMTLLALGGLALLRRRR